MHFGLSRKCHHGIEGNQRQQEPKYARFVERGVIFMRGHVTSVTRNFQVVVIDKKLVQSVTAPTLLTLRSAILVVIVLGMIS
jgi:hypothetical protein